jgi:MFS family permease
MGAVAIAFLVIGFALPVLPLHVHLGLKLSTLVVGIVTGSQFVASVLSRVAAGRFCDSRGPRWAVMLGLAAGIAGGLLYFVSLAFTGTPPLSVTILILGRALLGAAESFIITGGVAWGLRLAGPDHAGRVIAWVGMAMFAALALGAPVGTALYGWGGFQTIAAATTLIPLLALAIVLPMPAVSVQPTERIGLLRVLGAVWVPGLGSAFSTLGFGAMIGFSSLLATARGWSPVWLIFSAFAFALVAARLFLGHLPDRSGGAKVAILSVLIEAAGLALIWISPSGAIAALGAALAGLGYALVYPGLGAEAVRAAPPQSRGLAMGAYTVFLDIALGIGSPLLGFIGGRMGLGDVFLASAMIVSVAAVVAGCILVARRSE